MLLPDTVPGRASDIGRSYFALCIFADAGLQLKCSRHQNLRSTVKSISTAITSTDLYEKAEKLIEYLSVWDCDYTAVPKRMEQL